MSNADIERQRLFSNAWKVVSGQSLCGYHWTRRQRWQFVEVVTLWLRNRNVLVVVENLVTEWVAFDRRAAVRQDCFGIDLPDALARLVLHVDESDRRCRRHELAKEFRAEVDTWDAKKMSNALAQPEAVERAKQREQQQQQERQT